MVKYRYIFTTIIFALISVMVWRSSVLYNNIVNFLAQEDNYSITELNITANKKEKIKNTNQISKDNSISAGKGDAGNAEPIQQAIARINRDVIVTGTLTGAPGKESATFQIEGMADRVYKIDTQLMDGFIIKKITGATVTLKNQIGDEIIILHVQTGR